MRTLFWTIPLRRRRCEWEDSTDFVSETSADFCQCSFSHRACRMITKKWNPNHGEIKKIHSQNYCFVILEERSKLNAGSGWSRRRGFLGKEGKFFFFKIMRIKFFKMCSVLNEERVESGLRCVFVVAGGHSVVCGVAVSLHCRHRLVSASAERGLTLPGTRSSR